MVQQVNTQPAEVVVETPTFAQLLVIAVAAFSAQLGALNTARGGVTASEDSKVAAQTQLASALQTEKEATASEQLVRDAAIVARDNVVAVLQAWTP